MRIDLGNPFRSLLFLSLSMVLLPACTEYTPRPHGYPRIEFPERKYVQASTDAPYQFELPAYASLEKDTDPNSEKFWSNIRFPQFDATVHLSYKMFNSRSALDSLTEDAYKLAMKHTIRAEDIRETEIMDTSSGNYGVLYDFYGRTATPFNFYITDEKKHFLRGAFYFDKEANSDSVSPIFDFLKEDLIHLIETLEWQDH
ncbi:MAG: gliding motility lipoprotein GldD [Flavobacteriales bacterium]|nr:gliding motility lipoprotein GldD [Flavobacteriales bacterium]